MSNGHLDWDKLRVFAVVAELKSMTAAAARLGESTPTVSRKVDDLEKSLKCDLLMRSTRGVELTEAGRRVLKRAHSMADTADALWMEISGLDEEARGRIKLSVGDGLGVHWFAPRLSDFHRHYPHVELQMHVGEEPLNVLTEETDLAIVFAEPRHRDIESHRLGVLHYMFYASESYLNECGTPESLFDLQNHRCLSLDTYVNQIDRWSARAPDLKKALEYALVTNSGTVMREVCARGGGIALLPSYVHEYDPRLKPLNLPEIAAIQFWLIYSQRVKRLSRGRVVADWIRKQFDQTTIPWFREAFVHPARSEYEPDVPPAHFDVKA